MGITMQHRKIPYEYKEWTACTGQKCSAYTCKYFNFYPFHIISFSKNTEQEMKDEIDNLLNNRVEYEYRRKLTNAGAASFYANNHNNWTGD